MLKKFIGGKMCNLKKVLEKYEKMSQEFLSEKNKEERKAYSQYFTPLNEVDKMLENIEIDIRKKRIRILDPACGCGILILKLLETIIKIYSPEEIVVDCYDIDLEALNISRKILEEISINSAVINYNFYNKDFLKENNIKDYDYIITNPPYKKIKKDATLSKFYKYLNGQPNLYTLFLINSLEKLKKNGLFIMISPKNYLSGAYSKSIRKYILNNFSIERIHTFDERRKIFEGVLQEICIIHIKKSMQGSIKFSYNGNEPFILNLHDILIEGGDNIIMTPKSIDDVRLLNSFKQFDFGSIGKEIIFKPGKVVQFRVKEREETLKNDLYTEYKDGIPLIIPRHLNDGKFEYKICKNGKTKKHITIIDKKIQPNIFEINGNYLFVKKNVDKGIKKLFVSTTYFKTCQTDKIAIDNNIGYFTNEKNNLEKKIILGLKCLLESKQFNNYYHMINSNHTINVADLRNMFIPNLNILQEIGEKVSNKIITEDLASEIIDTYFI